MAAPASSESTAPGNIRASDAFKEIRRRKQVEHDATVLRNRILQLERQEQRADKRIEQTKQRAREVLEHRERNEQREREKQEALQRLNSTTELHQRNAVKCAPTFSESTLNRNFMALIQSYPC
jgi:chromosome segregation ATPase